ncbi:hypothetical protein HYG86_09705 [Alkalicella caledoniensis]|uniref:Uncharacterized protein n=1 Tax=Alkalicella caledoniensis TaxID=2731377 RepID=A0A7G9W8L1_ALKCA|nr:hypothetical protein [Alkalicella caledoniensis]QNO15023.1 hypothetical protein HYG86_09705 [Alkalicella caledoniensis]
MIIDLIMVNTVFWSFLLGYKSSPKITLYKPLILVISFILTLNIHNNVAIFSQEKVVKTILDNDYVIQVSEENSHREYLLTKSFVDELPVTTQMQNKIIENYYKDNTGYLIDELVETAGKTITKSMEVLLVLTIVIVFLNVVGSITLFKRKSTGSISSGVITVISNLIVVSIIILLINLISVFLLKDIPKISLEGSLFTPLIHKIIDFVINTI